MAELFSVYKVFRPATVILADDWTQMQLALVASFNKLGTARSDGLTGVATTFAVSSPVSIYDAVNLEYFNNNTGTATQALIDALEDRITYLEMGGGVQ
jgi:hypothetical protein